MKLPLAEDLKQNFFFPCLMWFLLPFIEILEGVFLDVLSWWVWNEFLGNTVISNWYSLFYYVTRTHDNLILFLLRSICLRIKVIVEIVSWLIILFFSGSFYHHGLEPVYGSQLIFSIAEVLISRWVFVFMVLWHTDRLGYRVYIETYALLYKWRSLLLLFIILWFS